MPLRFGPRHILSWLLAGLCALTPAMAQDKTKKDDKKDAAKPTMPEDKKGMENKKEDKKEEKKPSKPGEAEPVRCMTADGVELVGDFYPPPESVGKRAPTVILLHAVGPNRETASRKDFGDLPKRLHKEGFAVLTFDFRGYGESKAVDPQKYARAHNLSIGTTAPRKLDSRNFKSPRDLAYLVNDLVAIKIHLNRLNNEGTCSSHNVALVGIEQGAMVGLMWLFNENVDFNRSKGSGNRFGTPEKYEGEDIAGVVWISLNGRLGTQAQDRFASAWLAKIRDCRTATLVFFGQNDKDSVAFWKTAAKIIKPDRDKELYESTDLKRLKNTNLTGHKLLDSAAFDVEKDILAFLKNVLVKPQKLWIEHKGASRDPSFVDLRNIFGG